MRSFASMVILSAAMLFSAGCSNSGHVAYSATEDIDRQGPPQDLCAGPSRGDDSRPDTVTEATVTVTGPNTIGRLELLADWRSGLSQGEMITGYRTMHPTADEATVEHAHLVYAEGDDWLSKEQYVVVTTIEEGRSVLCRHVEGLRKDSGARQGGVRGKQVAIGEDTLTWMERGNLAIQIVDVNSGLTETELLGLASSLSVSRGRPGT